MQRSISIIGIGRIGGAISLALSRSGYRIKSLVARSKQVAEKVADEISPRPAILDLDRLGEESLGEIVLIASKDSEIKGIADKIESLVKEQTFVFHLSGALSSGILAGLEKAGGKVGSLHPLISISDPFTGAGSFQGAFFAIDGEAETMEVGRKIAEDIGGTPFFIPQGSKALYHASAVMACGHVVALFDCAALALSKCGIDQGMAKKILFPLLESTVANLKKQSNSEALTGPFARADCETLKAHLSAFDILGDGLARRIYLDLGECSLRLAAQKGTDSYSIGEMMEILKRGGERGDFND